MEFHNFSSENNPIKRKTLLEVRNLRVSFLSQFGTIDAVNDISYDLYKGDILGIVGESGAGKSVSARAIMSLLPKNGTNLSGSIKFDGKEITKLSKKQIRSFRGKEISIIFSNPMIYLNPLYTVGNHIDEVLKAHTDLNKRERKIKTIDLCNKVGFFDPKKIVHCYPHELSGGMHQRIMIAMALACEPQILIADEPTTALDITVKTQILDLLLRLKNTINMSIILITHDLNVLLNICDKIIVMYGGKILEQGTRDDIFYNAKQPYTIGLLNSLISLESAYDEELITIEGSYEDSITPPEGCPFSPRCPYCMKVCLKKMPPETVIKDEHKVLCWLLQKEIVEKELLSQVREKNKWKKNY